MGRPPPSNHRLATAMAISNPPAAAEDDARPPRSDRGERQQTVEAAGPQCQRDGQDDDEEAAVGEHSSEWTPVGTRRRRNGALIAGTSPLRRCTSRRPSSRQAHRGVRGKSTSHLRAPARRWQQLQRRAQSGERRAERSRVERSASRQRQPDVAGLHVPVADHGRACGAAVQVGIRPRMRALPVNPHQRPRPIVRHPSAPSHLVDRQAPGQTREGKALRVTDPRERWRICQGDVHSGGRSLAAPVQDAVDAVQQALGERQHGRRAIHRASQPDSARQARWSPSRSGNGIGLTVAR